MLDIDVNPIQNPYEWNVIDEESFKKRVREVFRLVSSALVKTLGPDGKTTILEKFGEMHITKDGWQVLKKIHFADSINNNIMQLLINISAQVVIKVGDGSTSSIVAANSLLQYLENCDELKSVRSKELLNVLSTCVERIAQKILGLSIKINKENDPDYSEIYRLAMIATNGDETVSRIIQEIYRETANPSIEFIQSKTNRTYHEIIKGYKGNITYLDSIFINNDNGSCNIDNPLILMFDHKIDHANHLPYLQQVAAMAIEQKRRAVIIAPNYDQFLLNYIKQITNSEYRSTGTSTVVYARASLINNMSYEQYNDFSVFTGGQIIRESDMLNLSEGTADLGSFIGEVGFISIGDRTTLIRDFYKRNQDMYTIVMNDAMAKYKKVEETHREMGIVNSELYELKQRVSKLKGLMGVIYVGGNSSLEKVSNYDLVEDAVKACESAYNYGYNIGGNLIIPIAISQIKRSEILNINESIIMDLFDNAFRDVFKQVLINKYKDEYSNDELDSIITDAVTLRQCYDLISEKYSNDVINSCFTDIEILRAATSIVSLLVSSNQYVSIMIKGEQ